MDDSRIYESDGYHYAFLQPMNVDCGAGIIAKNILSNIYGEKQINSELPLKISLINNRFWQIEGSLPPNMTGGTAIIVIKKDDGQIQYIRHTK